MLPATFCMIYLDIFLWRKWSLRKIPADRFRGRFFEIKFFFFCNKGKWSFLGKKKIICLPLLIFLMARINSPNIYLKKLQFCLLFFLFRVVVFNRLLYLPWIMGLEKISLFQTNDWITVSNDFFNFASYVSDHWLLP